MIILADLSEPTEQESLIERIRDLSGFYKIRFVKQEKSKHQESYYWVAIVEPLVQLTGHSKDEIHQLLKINHLPKDHTSTKDLTDEEYSEYIDRCSSFAIEMGIQL